MKRKKFKITSIILCLVLIIGIAVYLFRYPILSGIGKYLVVADPLQKADLVVALGGAKGRNREAVKLLRNGFAAKVMFVGYDIDSVDYQCMGVNEKEMLVPSINTLTTYEEAVLVLKTMKSEKFNSVIIITSAYHLRRVNFIFKKVFDGSGIKLIFHPAEKEPFSMASWWETYMGKKMIIMEYLGLVYYWARY